MSSSSGARLGGGLRSRARGAGGLAPSAALAAIALSALALGRPATADLRIHAEGGGLAPMDMLLRDVGPGFFVGGAVDYEVVSLLSVGLFYDFAYFLREPVDPPCDCPTDPRPADAVFDHAIGARLALRFVRHRLAGWFGADSGNLYGEAYLDLDLAYHNLGNEHRIGWGFGLGYRVLVAGPFGLGPLFRFRHVVAGELRNDAGEPVHQLYVTFGLSLFLSFDLTGGARPSGEPGAQRRDGAAEEDEWEAFESTGARE